VSKMDARFQHFTHCDVRHEFLQMSVDSPVFDYPGLGLHMPDAYDLLSGNHRHP